MIEELEAIALMEAIAIGLSKRRLLRGKRGGESRTVEKGPEPSSVWTGFSKVRSLTKDPGQEQLIVFSPIEWTFNHLAFMY